MIQAQLLYLAQRQASIIASMNAHNPGVSELEQERQRAAAREYEKEQERERERQRQRERERLAAQALRPKLMCVHNLPKGTTVAEMQTLFAPFGPIQKIFFDGSGQKATVIFLEENSAISARRKLHRSLFNGNEISIEFP
eukprot:TRINITY_DN932_c1_g2_i1.p2 TRINITY_DN932_c1_g2~~TRINITY_DN932_c1_g2_i1.p2  ORF type:complete len:140 (-),score=39.25 TRINITY_DN932_c1_g2_i1:14-433(-)